MTRPPYLTELPLPTRNRRFMDYRLGEWLGAIGICLMLGFGLSLAVLYVIAPDPQYAAPKHVTKGRG